MKHRFTITVSPQTKIAAKKKADSKFQNISNYIEELIVRDTNLLTKKSGKNQQSSPA